MMRALVVFLLLALAGSNLVWYRAYHKLDQDAMQGEALLDWSNDLLKDCTAARR